jgi:hypothetical protein
MADKAVGGPAVVKVTGGDQSGEIDDAAPSPTLPAKRIKTSVSASSSKSSALDGYVREGRKALQDRGDHALLVFVTCCGIPPKVVDAQEFKSFVSTLNTNYLPPSESTLRDTLIPEEAAKIHRAVINYLQGCRNLTITFDGGKLRQSKGLYSVHVTTQERRTFCLSLDDASRLSHTGEYIFELLNGVSGVQSTTNRTKKDRFTDTNTTVHPGDRTFQFFSYLLR